MSDCGKRDTRRPCLISEREIELIWGFVFGDIGRDTFYREMKKIKEKSHDGNEQD